MKSRSTGRPALTRDQIMRGKNLDPVSRTNRGKKGAAASPWSKGPVCFTANAARVFAANRPKAQ